MCFKIIRVLFICSLYLISLPVLSNNESNSESPVNSILGALSELTVEQAKKNISISFTRDIREQLCRLSQFNIRDEAVTSKPDHDNAILFDNTCDYVSTLIEKQIIDKQLLKAFQSDLVMNSILLATSKEKTLCGLISKKRIFLGKKIKSDCKYIEKENEFYVDADEAALSVAIESNAKATFNKRYTPKELEEYETHTPKRRLVFKLISLYLDQVPVNDVVEQLLYENEISGYLDTDVAEVSLKIVRQARNFKALSINFNSNDNDGPVNITVFEITGSGNDSNFVHEGTRIFSNEERKLIKYIVMAANSESEVSRRYYFKQLLIDVLKPSCNEKECGQAISLILKNDHKKLLAIFTENIANKIKVKLKKEIQGAKPDNFITSFLNRELLSDSTEVNDEDSIGYNMLGPIKLLSNLSKVKNRENAKAIFENYLADANSRTSRFWKGSVTLGTSLGLNLYGRTHCHRCSGRHRNSSMDTSLFMPFGMFFTKGHVGVQVHIFDLGQYTTNGQEDDNSLNYKEAFVPGFNIFYRSRRYPVFGGLDFTYKPSLSDDTYNEQQYRFVIAMDLHLFNIN